MLRKVSSSDRCGTAHAITATWAMFYASQQRSRDWCTDLDVACRSAIVVGEAGCSAAPANGGHGACQTSIGARVHGMGGLVQ